MDIAISLTLEDNIEMLDVFNLLSLPMTSIEYNSYVGSG